MAEVKRDEARSLFLCREILRTWSKESKVRYVPPVFRGSLKYKRWKIEYVGLYVHDPRPRIILNRESWRYKATVPWWKENILTLAHEFVHHLQFVRSGMDAYAAFPLWEMDKVHCMRTHEGEAKSISKEMTDQIFDRISKGEISLLPRDGLFTELERWFARDITGVERAR